MAATLGEAYVNIIPKAPGIESELKSMFSGAGDGAAEKKGKSLGQKLLGGIKSKFSNVTVGSVAKGALNGIGNIASGVIKTTAAAAAATTAITTAAIGAAMTAGGDLQQSFGGLDTIYGDASAAAKEYAQSAAQAGISANSYAEQAVSFGAALKQAYGGDTTAAMEAANTAIMDMTDNAAKMGTPLEQIQSAYQGFAKGNYTMLDNLKLGYGGTKSEMERLLAKAQEITGIEYNIDNLGDVYDAIHVIQGELGLTGTAALEAKTTLTGSLGAVKASWTNVMAAMTTGEGLDTAMANLSESVGNFATVALGMLQTFGQQAPTLLSDIGSAIQAQGPALLASGLNIIAQLAVGFINGIPDFLNNIPEFLEQSKAAFAALDWPSIGTDTVNGIIVGIKNAASSLFGTLRDLASSALNAAKDALGIASPSKAFANEVGKWIPSGMAVGIEANLSPVTGAVQNMAAASVDDFARAKSPKATAGSDSPGSISAGTAQPLNVNTRIEFAGSLAQLGRILRPYIVQEDARVGTSYVVDGGAYA